MTLGAMRYVPVLKARDAEIKALHTAPSALTVTPVFELQRAAAARPATAGGPVSRTKSTVTDASYFLDDIARHWSKPSYIDVSRVAAPADRGPWWTLLTALDGITPAVPPLLPVVSDLDPPAVRSAAATLAARAGSAALRLKMPHPSPAGLGATLAGVAADLGLTAGKLDVICDWGDHLEPEFVSLDNAQAHTAAVITALGTAHGEVITVGTPNSTAFVQAGDWQVTRREWWLWLRLAHAGVDVTYGDYALYPPADPVPAGPRYGHLRYSSGPDLFVHRRAVPSGGGGLAAAFGLCCSHLVSQPHYSGPTFSGADKTFQAAAAGTDQIGQAGRWHELAAEHHFALVADQLPSPPSAPSAGTP